MNKPLVLLSYCIDQVGFFQKVAQKKGFETLIIEEEDVVLGIVEDRDPSFVLGTICSKKVNWITNFMDSVGQPYEAIILQRNDCFKDHSKKSTLDLKTYLNALNRLEQLK